MIIFEDRTWQTSTFSPDTNYLEGIDCEQPKWVISDNSELTWKIMSTPYWEPIEDDNGRLIDIAPAERPISNGERIAKLKNELEELDSQAVRPLRAIAAGTDDEENRQILTDLEQQAAELRKRLAVLENQ